MSSQPLLQQAPGKRIALPVRIEPKVFFAAERTFCTWYSLTQAISLIPSIMAQFQRHHGWTRYWIAEFR